MSNRKHLHFLKDFLLKETIIVKCVALLIFNALLIGILTIE